MENNQIRLDEKYAIAPKRMAYSTPSLTVYGEIQDLLSLIHIYIDTNNRQAARI